MSHTEIQCGVAEQEVGSRCRLIRAGKAPRERPAPLWLSHDAGPHVRSVSRGRAASSGWLVPSCGCPLRKSENSPLWWVSTESVPGVLRTPLGGQTFGRTLRDSDEDESVVCSGEDSCHFPE